MEYEFRDGKRRRVVIIAVGIILAIVAGGAAYFLLNQAQEKAGQGSLQRVPVVVAVRTIPARQPIGVKDVAIRDVPLDPTNAAGVATDVAQVVGRIPAVTILQGQLVTMNALVSTTAGAAFSILGPGETVAPDSEAWRAISLTVPDDLAVGGLLKAGQSVDVFVTAVINVPASLVVKGQYYADRSTKVVYQNVLILARQEAFYIVRVNLATAEEIAHIQADGSATFSMALRPDADQRAVDASGLGETTNRIISKYGLPIPETYPAGDRPVSTLPPLPSPTPFPAPSSSPAH